MSLYDPKKKKYAVAPDGRIVTIGRHFVMKPGWREATSGDLAEAERKAIELDNK